MQRGERVVGHLRLGAGQAREQRRLAGVGKPDQAGVGEQLAAAARASAPRPAAPARRSAASGAWRWRTAGCRARRRRRAPPRARWPASVRSQRSPSSGSSTTVPGGTRTTKGSGVAPCLPAPCPWPPRLALKCAPRRKRGEVAQRGVADDDHVAAATAVAAVGPALGHVCLAAERDDAVAARARAHVDLGPVVEHVSAARRARTDGAATPPGARPRSRGRGGPWRTARCPARVAKIVSSRPRPTPSPGLKRVPRWRTMISPPLTVWPAKTFTPRRLAFESRPLRLDPRPFL